MSNTKQESQQMLALFAKVRKTSPSLPVKRQQSSVSPNWKQHPDFKQQTPSKTMGYVGIDCEMVSTEDDQNALARVSIVDLEGTVLLDEFVKPPGIIKNLRTPITGIKARHLKHARTLQQLKPKIHAVLDGKIVVGHAVHNDLKAIQLTLPLERVRDTQKLFKKTPQGRKNVSLKQLYGDLFNKSIQEGHHSSVEDARATLEIFKLKFLPKERKRLTT